MNSSVPVLFLLYNFSVSAFSVKILKKERKKDRKYPEIILIKTSLLA